MRLLNPLFFMLVLSFCSHIAGAHAGALEDALLAARDGRTPELAALLQRGLDPNTSDREGNTLLALAMRNGDSKMAELLISYRASPNRRNSFGDTPMLLAANLGRLDLVKRLHAAGGDLEPPGWTVLHYATFGGHTAVLEYVIAAGAGLDRRAPNQRTALMLAASNGNLEVAKLLLASGANPDLVDADNKTAADIASAKNFGELADFLASAKTVPNRAAPPPGK